METENKETKESSDIKKQVSETSKETKLSSELEERIKKESNDIIVKHLMDF